MNKKVLLILLLVVVGGVFVVLSFKMRTTKAIPVNVAEVKKTDLVEVVSASGRIQPQTKVDITAEVTGEIVKLNVREGQAVKAGDLLLVLDTVQLQADVDQARYALSEIRARLAGAKATLEQAKDEYQRLEKLYKQNLESERRFDDAKYAYENAKATYEALQAQVKQAEFRLDQRRDNLSKTKIVAPMDGVVTYLGCEEGEIAPAQTSFTAGKTLMTIANLDVFEVEVEVDETEINKIQIGQPAKIEIDAFPDTVFSGRVVEIGNTAILAGAGGQDQSTNFKVKVIFEESGV
ncbi:MAG: efflux RND transporter periplasmic adaptor subunit, partial [Candidatus Zixiibacteriota bacterium]